LKPNLVCALGERERERERERGRQSKERRGVRAERGKPKFIGRACARTESQVPDPTAVRARKMRLSSVYGNVLAPLSVSPRGERHTNLLLLAPRRVPLSPPLQFSTAPNVCVCRGHVSEVVRKSYHRDTEISPRMRRGKI
jgi:hypothetical protein